MSLPYTLFVDESGEPGIVKVRSVESDGSSPYMTLGAVLIRSNDRDAIQATIDELKSDFKKSDLHCSKLRHFQKLHMIKKLQYHKMKFFGTISKKETLGVYKDRISNDSDLYYNKCAQYLLERVGWFLENSGIDSKDVDIVFEKGNFDYEKMRNFIRKCQKNPMHHLTRKLSCIDANRIVAKSKDEDQLLQTADMVAHALFKIVDDSHRSFGITETRYANDLSKNFFADPVTGKIVGAGIYCVHSAEKLGLSPENTNFLNELRV